MRTAFWMTVVLCGLAACGDDSAAASDSDGSSSGDAPVETTGGAQESSTGQPIADTGGSVDAGTSGTSGTTAMRGDDSSSGGTAGAEPDADILVHTEDPDEPVVWSTADGSLVGWTTSDADGEALISGAEAGAAMMVSSYHDGQWTTISGTKPGDELWVRWRRFPDTEEEGQVRVILPAQEEHPTPGDVGFTQLSIGCGDIFVGVPSEESEAILPVDSSCVTASGDVHLIAYAQGGPQISVVGVAEVASIAWAAGETTDVVLPAWTPEPPEVLFTTTDALANPVYNTVHSQWIDGVKFPMPRRSGSPGTRLFPAPSLADELQYTGSTDLGGGSPPPSRMFFGERAAVPMGGSHDIPISELLLPEISGTSATRVDGHWQLSLQSSQDFDGTDAVMLQSRWAGGFWAVMAPPTQTSVALPDLPAELLTTGLGEGDTLDTPFAVVVDVQSFDGYDAFRPRGSYFFSGPDVLPGEVESFVRGAVYFPVPF